MNVITNTSQVTDHSGETPVTVTSNPVQTFINEPRFIRFTVQSDCDCCDCDDCCHCDCDCDCGCNFLFDFLFSF